LQLGHAFVTILLYAVCPTLVLLFLAVALRTRRQLREARAASAVLDTVPFFWFRWSTGQQNFGGPHGAPDYREFLAGLAAKDAAQLEAARQQLGSARTSFSRLVQTRQGGAFAVEGRQTAMGETVLWVADASAAQRAERKADSLREMVDTIPMPVWRRDAKGSLVDCNRAYAETVGTSIELTLVEGRELAPQARPRESRHVVVAGARRLFEISQAPAQGSSTIGFAIDRTDVESAEAELWRQINAYSEVLEGIRAAVAIYGSDRRLEFFNAAFASMWGIPEGWLAGQPAFDEILERLREARRLPETADFRAYKTEQLRMFSSVIEPLQDLIHLPDGRTLLLSISPHPLGGLTFVYEDVTDRLALERSCKTLTQVRRATLDHLFEGIAVYGSDGRLKLHNPAFLAIWGLSESDVASEPHIGDVLEKTRTLINDGGDWRAVKEGIVAKITAHAPASGPVYRNDGSTLQEATVPLPDGNVLVSYLDVTDSARVERALRERNEALETAARLKSEFIANISYELRTPLNAVIGFADILTKQYFGSLNPRQLDYSRYILHSAQQLMRLINDTLDLAAIEAGFMVLETEPVEVLDLLQKVLNLTRERAASRGLEIELQCPPNIGAIAADGKRLIQALFNLVSNAIRSTPAGGTIRIEAARVEGQLLLSVADTGVGIALTNRLRALEKSSHGVRQSAAGLGLSLVKSLIELHGGSLAIDSTPGQGMRISCRLPAAGPRVVGRGRAAMVQAETRAAA
jgi:signal transduction histidine kinase/PAS domain-containing protein